MSAEVTLKDLLIELKGQRADDKRLNRMALRSARVGVGKMTTRGVLAEAMFDRLEIGKTIGRAASVMSLGLKPAISGIFAARKTAKENKSLYKSRVQALVEDGRSNTDAAKIAKGAGEAGEGGTEQATAVNTSRIAIAVEKIASSLGEYIKTFGSGGADPNFGFAAGSSNTDEDGEGGGDNAAVKKKNMITRFASAAGNKFGAIYEKGRKIDFKAGAKRFGGLASAVKNGAKTMIAGIGSVIATAFTALTGVLAPIIAALLPAMPFILAAAAAAGAVAVAAAAVADAINTNEELDVMFAKMREDDEYGVDPAGRSMAFKRRRDIRMGASVSESADLELRRLAALRENLVPGVDPSTVKTDVMDSSGNRFTGLTIPQAETLVKSSLDAHNKGAAAGMFAPANQMTLGERMDFDSRAESRPNQAGIMARSKDKPIDWHDARHFTDTEYMEFELDRLRSLRNQGVRSARTISDLSLLYSPVPIPEGSFVEMDIDQAIANVQKQLSASKGLFIGTVRQKVQTKMDLQGTSVNSQRMNETADEMEARRPGKFEIFGKGILNTGASVTTHANRDLGTVAATALGPMALTYGVGKEYFDFFTGQTTNNPNMIEVSDIERRNLTTNRQAVADATNAVVNAPVITTDNSNSSVTHVETPSVLPHNSVAEMGAASY